MESNLITQAIELAAQVHYDQTDKSGVEYILHPIAVMQTVDLGGRFITESDRTNIRCAAILHDVIEDFRGAPGESSELQAHITDTFGQPVARALDALTHPRHEPYDDYIERVAQNWIARRVKIADLKHNLNPDRMPLGEITERDFKRWAKYQRALVRLDRED